MNRCWQLKHKAKNQRPRANSRFSHTPATYLMALSCAEMHPYQTHFSPLEAAEAGTQTVGHSPQRCRPFRVAPPMPLSVLPLRTIGETLCDSQQNSSRKRREMVHLDNAALQNHSILKRPFQNPHVCVVSPVTRWSGHLCLR